VVHNDWLLFAASGHITETRAKTTWIREGLLTYKNERQTSGRYGNGLVQVEPGGDWYHTLSWGPSWWKRSRWRRRRRWWWWRQLRQQNTYSVGPPTAHHTHMFLLLRRHISDISTRPMSITSLLHYVVNWVDWTQVKSSADCMLMKWSSTPTDLGVLGHATASDQRPALNSTSTLRVTARVFVTCCVVELSLASQIKPRPRLDVWSLLNSANPNYRVVLGVKAPLRDNV